MKNDWDEASFIFGSSPESMLNRIQGFQGSSVYNHNILSDLITFFSLFSSKLKYVYNLLLFCHARSLPQQSVSRGL